MKAYTSRLEGCLFNIKKICETESLKDKASHFDYFSYSRNIIRILHGKLEWQVNEFSHLLQFIDSRDSHFTVNAWMILNHFQFKQPKFFPPRVCSMWEKHKSCKLVMLM
jgi:hypothetical protein